MISKLFSLVLEKISSLLPFRFLYEKKTSEFIFDTKTIKDGEAKIVEVWSWKRMKHEKFVIVKKGKHVYIRKIE